MSPGRQDYVKKGKRVFYQNGKVWNDIKKISILRTAAVSYISLVLKPRKCQKNKTKIKKNKLKSSFSQLQKYNGIEKNINNKKEISK